MAPPLLPPLWKALQSAAQQTSSLMVSISLPGKRETTPPRSSFDRPPYASKAMRSPAHRLCKSPGCTKFCLSRGHCVKHGGGKQCGFEGCTTTAQSGGFCKVHGGGSKCKYGNCVRTARRFGRCTLHGGKLLCEHHTGCTKGAVVKGRFCMRHSLQR